MDTVKIKALLSAVKNKSLSKAAEEFSYTPSALSHMADSLEEELGVKILVRTPQGVFLSKEGEELYSKLEAVILAEQELLREATSLASKSGKLLKIGAYSSISEHLLPEILMEFKKEYPEIKFSVMVGDGINELLKTGETDVIFSDGVLDENFDFSPIMKDDYLAVIKSELMPVKKTVEIEELYRFNFIDVGEKSIEKYVRPERFADLVKIESPENASVLSLVRQGLGVAFLPSLALTNKPQGVRALKVIPKFSRTIGFAYRKGVKRTLAVKKFIEFLEKAFLEENKLKKMKNSQSKEN